MKTKCIEQIHYCVMLGCDNHAVYGNEETDDYYCYTDMLKNCKEDGWGRDWKRAGYYRETCPSKKELLGLSKE